MHEIDPVGGAVEAPPQRRARRLPAWIRYPVAAVLGVLIAVLASYLIRKIGF